MTNEFPTAIIALAEKWAREANVVPPDVHPNHIANILQLSPFGPEITKEQWVGWVKIYRGYRDQELQPKLAAEEATKEWFQMLPGQTPTEQERIELVPQPDKPFKLTVTFYVEAFKHDITIVGTSGTELLTKVHGVLQAIKNIGGQAWYEMQAVTPVVTHTPVTPAYTPPPPVPTYPPPQSTGPTPVTPVCPVHGKPMKPSQYGGWYCTQKLPDGSYCPHKA